MLGHRGFYRDGWEAVTNHQGLTPFGDHEWSLFDVRSDPSQIDDVREQHPDKVAELSAAWERDARANQVYPIDEGAGLVWITRPPSDEIYARPVTLRPGTPSLERWRASQLIAMRAFDVEIRLASVGEGVLVAHGDQGGGYVVAIEDERLQFGFNSYGDLTTVDGGAVWIGTQDILVRFSTRPGLKWGIELFVDGVSVGGVDEVGMLIGMSPLEGIDVGVDRRSPVSWPLFQRHGAFAYSGVIGHVRYVPGEMAPDGPAAMRDILVQLGLAFE
jgi:arylsulfatase